jgi:hypothetical protein
MEGRLLRNIGVIVGVCFVFALTFGVARPLRGQAPSASMAQPVSLDPAMGITTLPLWNGTTPGAEADSSADIPTLTAFVPHPGRGNGTAVVVSSAEFT